jgi:hypothetical protein
MGRRGGSNEIARLLAPDKERLCQHASQIMHAIDEDPTGGQDWNGHMVDVLSRYVGEALAMRVADSCDGEGCLEQALEMIGCDLSY